MWMYWTAQGKEQLNSAVSVCVSVCFTGLPLSMIKFPCSIPGGRSTLLLSEVCSFRPEPFALSNLGSVSGKFGFGIIKWSVRGQAKHGAAVSAAGTETSGVCPVWKPAKWWEQLWEALGAGS